MDSEKIISLINTTRVKLDVKPVQFDQRLTEAAAKKVQEMIRKDYFSHHDRSQNTILSFLPKEYSYTVVGENLAFGFRSEEEVVKAWLKSPSHRAILLDQEFSDTGLSTALVQGKWLIAQVFATQQEDFLQSKTFVPQTSVPIFTSMEFLLGVVFFTAFAIMGLGWLVLHVRRRLKQDHR